MVMRDGGDDDDDGGDGGADDGDDDYDDYYLIASLIPPAHIAHRGRVAERSSAVRSCRGRRLFFF